MAGTAAAWRLSEPRFADQIESVTIYQRGWRLGGKGASSRGAHGRIEEHGLHIWLGYYENAFRLLQACYAELDRPTTDPACPIRTWRDALHPSTEVGLEDRRTGAWRHWVGDFATNDLEPGDGVATAEMSPAEFVRRGIALLQDFFVSLTVPPPTSASTSSAGAGWTALRGVLGLALEATRVGLDAAAAVRGDGRVPVVEDALLAAQRSLRDVAVDDPDVRQTWELVSVVVATIRGLLAEGLLNDTQGIRKLNSYDYRDWIRHHGASDEAVDSTLVRGLYDLVFGYADGDIERPGFGAGLGVFLSGKTFFDYKGAIFWKMQAGMGDIVFAPLYQALRSRGVRFEFFCNVEELRLTADASSLEAVQLGLQATPRAGHATYEPLERVGGLPVFPDRPLVDQLDIDGDGRDSESWWSRDRVVERRTLEAGRDFDDLVFALPVGMARHVAGNLAKASQPWQSMVDGLGVVATQALQVWLRESEEELGWHRPGVTISGYVKPFDTWSSMPQLISAEQWPADESLQAIEYFCATLRTPPGPPSDERYPVERHEEVYENARVFLEHHVSHYLPGSASGDGFRWELLCGAGDGTGSDRLRSQYWRANVDPSDLYVQSLPGTDRLRLRADQSGFDRLFLAGDWTDNGVNAGCIESATLSGIQAANAVLGRPLLDDVAGTYLPLNDRP